MYKMWKMADLFFRKNRFIVKPELIGKGIFHLSKLDMISYVGIDKTLNICLNVAEELRQRPQEQISKMLDNYLDEYGPDVNVDLRYPEKHSIIEQILYANTFYSTVIHHVVAMEKIICCAKFFSPLALFLLDHNSSETDNNLQALDELSSLSEGSITDSGMGFLKDWLSSFNETRRNFYVRLACAVIVHLDLLALGWVLIQKLLSL